MEEKAGAEVVVRESRERTRKKYSTEEKLRSCCLPSARDGMRYRCVRATTYQRLKIIPFLTRLHHPFPGTGLRSCLKLNAEGKPPRLSMLRSTLSTIIVSAEASGNILCLPNVEFPRHEAFQDVAKERHVTSNTMRAPDFASALNSRSEGI